MELRSRWLSEETMVKNPNIPFGLGWDIHVVSDYPDARAGHFVSTDRLHRMVSAMTGRVFADFAGISIKHEETHSYVIAISRSFKGDDVTTGRLIEVISLKPTSKGITPGCFSPGD